MTAQERTEELTRLENFFSTTALPQAPVEIGGFMKLNNIRTFIDTNLTRASNSINGPGSEPCILRLQQLESHMLGQHSGLVQQ